MKRYPKRARPLWGRGARKPRIVWTGLTFSFGPGVDVVATEWAYDAPDEPIRHVGSIGVIAFDSPGGPVDQFNQALAEMSRDGVVLVMPREATFEIVEVRP